jgi:hypothetical protein
MFLLLIQKCSHLRRRLTENDHHIIEVPATDTLPLFYLVSVRLGTIQIGEDLAEVRILVIDHSLSDLLRWHISR